MRLASICRYPVKGFTPDPLEAARLEPGTGIAFDRAAGFTSGNLPDAPVPGGWVPARTFLQLTVYPELARFRSVFDEKTATITIKAPGGDTASARLGDPASFAAVNAMMQRHFAVGPHGAPHLAEQAPRRGHWDFTDSVLSICNLETVRQLEAAAGRAIDPHRFRANLYVEGLPAWEEFGLIGRRLRVADAELEIMRPAMRCAATSVDPVTGDLSLDVPELLHRSVGHTFCAVYARVVEAGSIACGDPVWDAGESRESPAQALPPRAPAPRQWPRIVKLDRRNGAARLLSLGANWPLAMPAPGAKVRLHPGLGGPAATMSVLLEGGHGLSYSLAEPDKLAGLADGSRLIMTGPYGP